MIADHVDALTQEQLRRTVQGLAFEIAVARHRRRYPTADPHDAITWASDNWRDFEDDAVRFLATAEALRERERGPSLPPPLPS